MNAPRRLVLDRLTDFIMEYEKLAQRINIYIEPLRQSTPLVLYDETTKHYYKWPSLQEINDGILIEIKL